MDHRILTLGRQYGSGGRAIGRKLSESLGLAFYDEALLSMAAQRAEIRAELFTGKDEKASTPWLFQGIYEGGPRVHQGDAAEDILFSMEREIILELAQSQDCLIVGHCADDLLDEAGIPHLSLFLSAPFSHRLRRRMELDGLSEKETAARIQKTDRQRAKYYAANTDRAWGSGENYDLCINTSLLGLDGTATYLTGLLGKIWEMG